MILNVRIVGAIMALLFIVGAVTLATGDYFISFLCVIGLGALSSHMKKHEKFYESELDELYPDDSLR